MTYQLESKRPAEVRIYTHDWSGFLGEDTISTSTWAVADAAIVIDSDTNDDTTATVTVSGGTAGTIAQLTNTIVTSLGETEIETFLLPVVAADEPVNLSEAKAQCRMAEDTSEDSFIASLIAPARAYVERVSRYLFVGGERTETFTRWGDYLEIWRQPITSIDSVTYSTTDDPLGDETLTGFVSYLGFPARVSLEDDFPDLIEGGTITVTYTAGAVASTSEAYLIGKRAMLLLIGYWFDNRGEVPLSREAKLAFDEILRDLSPVSAY
jgi:uncharacterized phiE125 gp8 family phage protein